MSSMALMKIGARITVRLTVAAVRHHGGVLGRSAVSFWVLQVVAAREVRGDGREQPPADAGAARAARAWCSTATASVLVENRQSYSISIVREHTKDSTARSGCWRRCSASTRRRARDRRSASPRADATGRSSIVQDATLAQVAAVTARRLDFELPDVARRTGADAPVSRARMAAHLFGYVGEVSDAQVADDDSAEERRHRRAVGHREDLQRAADGRGRRQARRRQQRRARDPDARRRRRRPKASGCSSRSTTTCRRRSRTGSMQLGFNGAAVVLDPNNGDVLGFTSRPAYDPNAFAAGHRSRDVGVADDRRGSAAERSRDSGHATRRDRRSRWRSRWRRSRKAIITPDFHVHCAGGATLLRPAVQVLEEGRPRLDRSAPRHRAVVQRVLLHRRQHGRRRQDPQVGDAARARREERHRPAERGAGPRAVDRVEARDDAREVVRRRDDLGRRSARARCR